MDNLYAGTGTAIKMPKHYRKTCVRLLSKAICSLLYDQVAFDTKLEINGILCLVIDGEDEDIVIKINKSFTSSDDEVNSFRTTNGLEGRTANSKDDKNEIANNQIHGIQRGGILSEGIQQHVPPVIKPLASHAVYPFSNRLIGIQTEQITETPINLSVLPPPPYDAVYPMNRFHNYDVFNPARMHHDVVDSHTQSQQSPGQPFLRTPWYLRGQREYSHQNRPLNNNDKYLICHTSHLNETKSPHIDVENDDQDSQHSANHRESVVRHFEMQEPEQSGNHQHKHYQVFENNTRAIEPKESHSEQILERGTWSKALPNVSQPANYEDNMNNSPNGPDGNDQQESSNQESSNQESDGCQEGESSQKQDHYQPPPSITGYSVASVSRAPLVMPFTTELEKSPTDTNTLIKCSICDISFDSLKTCVSHYKSAHRLFLCHVCYKTFSQQASVQRHIRLHTGTKPYSCDDCKASFYRLDSLHNHKIRIHLHSKFICPLCPNETYVYNDRGGLRQHLKVKHGIIKMAFCPSCNKCFPVWSEFLQHRKSCSGISNAAFKVDGTLGIVLSQAGDNDADNEPKIKQ